MSTLVPLKFQCHREIATHSAHWKPGWRQNKTPRPRGSAAAADEISLLRDAVLHLMYEMMEKLRKWLAWKTWRYGHRCTLRTQPGTICDQEASHGQEAQQSHGQEASHDQAWNGTTQCCTKNCPSWIYVRKSNWYHSCQLRGMPLVTSLSDDLPQGPWRLVGERTK